MDEGVAPAVEGTDLGLADEILARAADLRARGESFVVATVVRVQAPTSSQPGNKALITGDGKLWGWIGGSCSEGLVRQEALRALADGQPRLVQISADKSTEHAHGVVAHVNTCPSGGSLDVFIDPQRPRPLLLVVGSTPVARTLIRLGAAVGFRTAAVHPGASAADFPGADVVFASLNVANASLPQDTWAVVATMGHYDEDALQALLSLDLAYVGLIASRRRAAAVRTALTNRGVAGLDRIHRPGDEAVRFSQQEIALVALNEVVGERRGRQAIDPLPALKATSAIDPVCGMTVDSEETFHRVPAEGGMVYFCSAHCRDAFVAAAAR